MRGPTRPRRRSRHGCFVSWAESRHPRRFSDVRRIAWSRVDTPSGKPPASRGLERPRDDLLRVGVVANVGRDGVYRVFVAGEVVEAIDASVVEPVGQNRLAAGGCGGSRNREGKRAADYGDEDDEARDLAQATKEGAFERLMGPRPPRGPIFSRRGVRSPVSGRSSPARAGIPRGRQRLVSRLVDRRRTGTTAPLSMVGKFAFGLIWKTAYPSVDVGRRGCPALVTRGVERMKTIASRTT